MSIDIDQLLQGQRRALAKAITLTESKLDSHREQAQQLINTILPHTGKSVRLGITGIPGVGKSTFIEALGLHLVESGKKVAVLAVDPSSPITGGSILGDKTRMERLSQQDAAFIRPSPSSGALGGVAQKTRETILLCEAAGYDVIIVETVGVGQSEYEVAAMVDFFLVLMLPNAGDELQGIKKGILELADSIVVNKADGDSKNMAKRTKSHYQNALHLLQHSGFWTPQVLTCSAVENKNIDSVWEVVTEFHTKAKENSHLENIRAQQNRDWMWKLVHELLELHLKNNPKTNSIRGVMEQKVISNQITPFEAANTIMSGLIDPTD
ncbi:MAG: methylmalonyl Co-A mutase-associated GTPase MeaB [Pseudomonadales bacterium]|nr:methylmalonyl Co-A mutase-associated GTPase MeaB [Pseudomonadales bacterium]